MIRGYADVRGALFGHLQHGVQHTDNGPEWFVLAFGKAAQAVEMAEELVGAVDEVNDHGVRLCGSRLRRRSRPVSGG